MAGGFRLAGATGSTRRRGQVHEGIFALLQRFRGIAETIGEWAFYAAVILIVLALVKRFPYRWFFRTHRWLALICTALVVHAVVLTPPDYWTSPLGLVLAVLMAAGSLAACISLLRRIGRKHKVVGRIESLTHHRDNRVLRVDIKLDGAWPGHKAGQFAFVTFDDKEGPHPSASPRPGATTAGWPSPSRASATTPAPCPRHSRWATR